MTEQTEFWKGNFGDEYTKRNTGDLDGVYKGHYGVTKSELNREFLKNVELNKSILEVGCNHGWQLCLLKKQGFNNLWAIEINKTALGIAKENKEFNIVEATALDIPFKDDFFEVVFTDGVLIHIHPIDLPKAIDEIYRISRRYIWVNEYFSEECQEIEYRGHKNKLWKNNFMKLFLERHPDLKVVKERKLPYVDNPKNIDHMFFLEKIIKI